MTALGHDYPATNANLTARVVPLAESVFGNVQPALLVLWGASGLVLMITCLTVSNLLIGREIVRSQEVSVRLALGATRARIARLLLTEHLLLIAGGVAGGLALSVAVWRFVLRVSPLDVPRLDEIGLDRTVLLFAMGLVLVVAALSSLVPIVLARDRQASTHLTGERVGRKGYGGRRAQDILVVCQLTVTLALLVGAGLLGKSFSRLTQVRLGFDPTNVATMRVALPSTYRVADIDAFSRQLKERVERIPGVRYASRSRRCRWASRVSAPDSSSKAIVAIASVTCRQPTCAAFRWDTSTPWAFRSSRDATSTCGMAPPHLRRRSSTRPWSAPTSTEN